MENRLVSVIIPTYKRNRDYLYRAVNSVVTQSYRNLEIIVIDDSPADYPGREEVSVYLDGLCAADRRVKYYKNDGSLGGSLARNRGISLSHGYYITFLDDDDEYLPDKVKNQVAFMEEKDCDASLTDMIMYNTQGTVVDVRTHEHFYDYSRENLLQYHLTYHLGGTPTFMFKAEEIKRIGGFDDVSMGQEFHLMLKAIKNGLTIDYIPICDVKIYKHRDGGISQGANKIIGEKKLYEFKKDYFSVLTGKQIRFVRFRHYVVMGIAYARCGRYFPAIGNIITAFFMSPGDSFREVVGYIGKLSKKRNNR